LGLLIYYWKGLENTFAMVYYTPQNFKYAVATTKKKILQSSSDCRIRWSKEPQWENDCGSFSQYFLLVLALNL
jgi:hypothetical protein